MLKNKTSEERFVLISAIVLVVISLGLSLTGLLGMEPHYGPDEIMRFDVAEWIYVNGRLPWGNEPELISAWGFNYSLAPYLPSIVSAMFMKVMSLFTTAQWPLFVAYRMPSFLSHLTIGIFSYLTARRLFHKAGAKLCFIAFSVFWPQILYMGSYLNNDIFALALCYGVLFCWVYGMQEGWNWKSVIGFGAVLGLLTITYYYAYGWILCSILFFCFTLWKQKKDVKEFWQKTLSVIGVAFMTGGWFFIKNFIFMPGDFLGFKSTDVFKHQFAVDKIKGIVVPADQMSLKDMLLKGGSEAWWIRTLRSYLGSFQLYSVVPTKKQYVLFGALILPSAAAGCLNQIWKGAKSKNSTEKMFVLCQVLSFVIPIGLTVFSSYYIDFQPQGRYMISSLPALVLWISFGMQVLSDWVNGLLQKHAGLKKQIPFACMAAFAFALLAAYVYLQLNWSILFEMYPYFTQPYVRPI